MNKEKIKSIAERGIYLLDGGNPDDKCPGCRNCDEGLCEILACFVQIQKLIKDDNNELCTD